MDPILGHQRASIAALHDQGIVQRTRFTLEPTLRYRTQTNAEVEDCVRGPANTYHDAATGRLRAPRGYRNDAPTEDRLLTTLQRRGDRWYVVAATGRGRRDVLSHRPRRRPAVVLAGRCWPESPARRRTRTRA